MPSCDYSTSGDLGATGVNKYKAVRHQLALRLSGHIRLGEPSYTAVYFTCQQGTTVYIVECVGLRAESPSSKVRWGRMVGTVQWGVLAGGGVYRFGDMLLTAVTNVYRCLFHADQPQASLIHSLVLCEVGQSSAAATERR